MTGPSDLPLVVMIPVYDDWESLQLVLASLDQELGAKGLSAKVVLVDDGSIDPGPKSFGPGGAKAITEVLLISLTRNVGHQRAIAVGLAWIHAHLPCWAVVVMDGDGEDDPRDVPRLVAACRERGDRAVVFAARTRRCEGVGFRIGYALFRLIHQILVGRSIRFGNFSIVPRAALARLASVSELWIHYAAAVLKAKLPYDQIPTQRATRLRGSSKMSLVSLVTHGLSAMSVSGEIIGTRLLVGAAALVAASLVGTLIVVVTRIATPWAIPGWATYTVGVLLIVMIQAIMAALMFAFITLSARNSVGFLPSRDYPCFVMRVERQPIG
jgi:hypothetical protein